MGELRRDEARLTTNDGTGLLARSWSPAELRASLLLIHGYSSATRWLRGTEGGDGRGG